MTQNEIGSFIAALRKAGGMTQRELAERIGVSDKSVSRWERGDGLPDLMLIPVIAEVFDITCDELLTGKRQSDQRCKSRDTQQQIRRLCTIAVEKLKAYAVTATLIALLALVLSTAFNGVWSSITSCALVGVALLMVAAVVMWFGLTQYRGRLEGDMLTVELHSETWGKVFPYLSVFAGAMSFGVLYLSGKVFLQSKWLWGYWDILGARSSEIVMLILALLSVLLFYGWIRPLLTEICVTMGLNETEIPMRRWERRMSRVLTILLIVTAVLHFGVYTAPYGLFIQGTKCEDFTQLQQYLNEKKPMFLTEAQEKSYVAANTYSVTGTDGKTYHYQNYGLRDDIVFTAGKIFPATVYTGGEQDLAREIQSYIYKGIFYCYPVEIALCGGIYLLAKGKSKRKCEIVGN